MITVPQKTADTFVGKSKSLDPSQDADQQTPAVLSRSGFPIVGIGASAGGLDAFTQVLGSIPSDTGMAFVLVQHLDPSHESMSTEILSRTLQIPVTEVTDGMRVMPNHVYIIPPNFRMGISQGCLRLLPRVEVRGQHLVIDFFLQSLAEDQKFRAVGVILSGTGSDGTQGLMAIKTQGGITIAQDPKSAKFDSMPESAIAAGIVDLILSPRQIAEELVRMARHPYILPPAGKPGDVPTEDELGPQDSLSKIFLLLRNACHVDFTHYKSNTIHRRIERRMVLHRLETLDAYVKLLSRSPDEVKKLYADILIHVTGFFRDPPAFEGLKGVVLPKLIADRTPGSPIRVWVPGCSTGEEAYSLAILLVEFLGNKAAHAPIQIFGSDIGEPAIQKARVGEYPESIANDISPQRLSRFFTRMDGGGYKIVKSIRDVCLFSRHDITCDPPFAKIDLISCRNLLIYFTPTLQKHVMPIFHYSLKPLGFLWLGRSETIGGSSEFFTPLDKANQIYSRKDAPISLNLTFPASTYVPGKPEAPQKTPSFSTLEVDVQKVSDQAIQSEFPGVLVNEAMEIVQFRGRTAPFIEAAPGLPTHNLFRMAHPDLSPSLRIAIQAAKKQNSSIKKEGLKIKDGRKLKPFTLRVIRIKASPSVKVSFYLILFEGVSSSMGINKMKTGSLKKGRSKKEKADPRLAQLQQELDSSLEYQNSLIEKYETAQQDLTTANEELQSTNEELQSTNEELETAKEELQSGNEELTTVNDELRTRSQEQTQTNNDLINLLGSAEIPIIMLDSDRRIRRFTPLAGKAMNLISSDVGRPIGDLKLNLRAPGLGLDLERMVSEVIETNVLQELEVQDSKGCWYHLQVRPYKTIENQIDGAVLALVDINTLRQSLNEARSAKLEAEKANRAKDLFLATLSHELRTPLTAILSWAQMLRTGRPDPTKTKRAAAMIEEGGKAQVQLINDLLDVSRIIVGKVALELSELNPVDTICTAIESVRPSADKNSITIESFFDPRVGTIMADPIRLQQVFLNLLTNAVKFSAPHSTVSIRLEKSDDEDGTLKAKALIKVIDSGKGIGSDFLPYVFDRFSQEDSSSVRAHGGLGLGLAIVRNLVELQGGTVKAESPGENQGATFTIVFPIKSHPIASKTEETHQRKLSDSRERSDIQVRLDGLRILVVDDEASAREPLSEMLSFLGARVQAVASVEEALRVFAAFAPQVLVCDIAMPEEDGYSLIRKVRALGPKNGGDTPALVLSAYAGDDHAKKALLSCFQAHMSKPYDVVQLSKIVAEISGLKTGE